ncbi:MAG: hypothetical protein ACO1SX_00190 [Actinomycetota bacterium]
MKTFAKILAADAEVRVEPFEVEGQPGELHLRMMDARDRNTFETRDVNLSSTAAGELSAGVIDVNAKMVFLMSRTIIGGHLPQRSTSVADGAAVWGRTEIPTNAKAREHFFANTPLLGEFWDWAVLECMRENGWLADDAGNS